MPRKGADLLVADVSAACLGRLKNIARSNEGLQLILNLIFHRKLLPQTLDSYINAPLIDSHYKYCLFRK